MKKIIFLLFLCLFFGGCVSESEFDSCMDHCKANGFMKIDSSCEGRFSTVSVKEYCEGVSNEDMIAVKDTCFNKCIRNYHTPTLSTTT